MAAAAAAPAAARPEHDLLSCPVCTEPYELASRVADVAIPLITECGHTCCKKCLKKLAETTRLCPTCRKGFDPSKAMVNFAIGDAQDALRQLQTSLHEAQKQLEAAPGDPKLRAELEAKKNESKELSGEVSQLKEAVKVAQERFKKTQGEIKKLRGERQKKLAELQREIKNNQKEIKRLIEARDNALRLLQEVKGERNTEIEKLTRERDGVSEELKAAKVAIAQLEQEKEVWGRELIRGRENEIANLYKLLAAKDTQILDLQSGKKASKHVLEIARMDRDAAQRALKLELRQSLARQPYQAVSPKVLPACSAYMFTLLLKKYVSELFEKIEIEDKLAMKQDVQKALGVRGELEILRCIEQNVFLGSESVMGALDNQLKDLRLDESAISSLRNELVMAASLDIQHKDNDGDRRIAVLIAKAAASQMGDLQRCVNRALEDEAFRLSTSGFKFQSFPAFNVQARRDEGIVEPLLAFFKEVSSEVRSSDSTLAAARLASF